ncbi:uncharacterized protein LOC141859796 [Acropora palmata]
MEFLGVRVVRGPDWEWSNQDGGEGSVGTVVQIGSDAKLSITEPIVLVQWDGGTKANYRAGMDGKYDLRILDSANGGERHLFTSCDGCQQKPIIGSRWHCKTCPSYDLCTRCYMTDCHDNGHTFERIDRSRGMGVEVGKRCGSTKIEARGLFKGAKVTRSPDLEGNSPDRDPNVVGEVEEVVSSNDEDTKDSVRVSWKKGGQTFIYRVGKDGKVDLKCTVPAIGGSYYRDHLPALVLKRKKSQSGFTTGDKVIVELTCKQLEKLSSGHGEWNADMDKFIGKVGVVQDFTSNGDVVVEYPDKSWRYNPKALTKIKQFKRGDEVLVKTDKNLVKELQNDHGGWYEAMISILGRIGNVLDVDGNGDLVVLIEGERWLLNPAAVTYVTDPEIVPGRSDSDHATEIPTDFFRDLMRAFLHQNLVADIASKQLVMACKQNMISRVCEILDNNPALIDTMVGGHTALHVACHEGHCNIIRELIERGADEDKLDDEGYTAIHHAAYGDKTGEALKLLLNKGFDPNVQDSENRNSPLHLAVQQSNEMAVRILTQDATCDVNLQDKDGDTPLHCAIAGENHNMEDMLLNSPRLMRTITNHKSFNYLQFAVLKGNKPAVEKLLEKTGSTLNVAKDDGFTTLHIAAINGYGEIAKILLGKPGCCVNAVAFENQTPLHLAAEEGYPDMAEVLLDHGADVNAANAGGDTPLHLSLKKELMFKSSLQPALRMLFFARELDSGGHAAVSRCLLNYGADVRRRNNTGETPLDRCRGTEVELVIRDTATKGNSSVTKVPTLGRATKHPGFTHQGGNDSRATEEHLEDVDRSNGRETNKTKRNFNDNEEHGLASGETVNNSQEEGGRQDEKQKEDVLVQNDFALTKQFKGGDKVLVKNDKNLVKELQVGHGGWNETMVSILGQIGRVLDVDGNGDLVVLVKGERKVLNPAAVTCVTDPEIVPDSDDESDEIPADFFPQLFNGFLRQNVVADNSSNELSMACRQNKLSRVREILDNNPGLIDTVAGGQTALHIACHKGHCNIIRKLIDRGADKDKVDDKGYTAVHHAANGDKTGEALKLLLDKGFDPNVRDSEKGNSPLHLAVNNSNEVVVRILTQHTACDVNLRDHDGNTPLHCAVAGEKQNMVEMLLNNPRLSLTITNHKDFNYLQFAVLKGNKPAVEKLLEITGSTLNVAKDDGYATLHIAAVNGYGEIAKILLEQPGCSVNAAAEANQTPLHLAALRGYPDMVEVLLDHGADVNAVDCDGDTPLHLSLQRQAVFKNPMSALHMLLGLGGLTGSYDAVSRCLLSYGADVRRRNNSGETPLDRCRGTEVEQVIQDIAAKGRSNAPKVPTFGAAASHPGFAQQGDNDSTEVAKHVEAVDHSYGRETKENMSNSNDEKGHRQAAGEIVNDSHEEERQDEEQMEDVLVKNEFAQNFKPLIQNVFPEAANQVLDTPLEEISNTKLSTAGVTMNDGAAACAENSDLTNEKNSKLSKKRPNETSKIIEPQNGDSEMVDLRDEGNAPEEQEPKRQKLICRICEENEALVAFKPCGHIILCSECAPRLKHCLECQTRILEKATRDGIPVISVNNKSLVTKYQVLEGKMRKLEESIECCICTTRKKNVVFLCGHGSCQYCADQLKTCHICQTEITRKIQIF